MKQRVLSVLLAAGLTASSLFSITASAAADVKLENVLHLTKALTAQADLKIADDFNADGIVNAVDLTLEKRALLAAEAEEDTGELKAQTFKATAENVKLISRTMTANGITWLPQSGSAVEFTVTGTEASVTVTGDGNIYAKEIYQPRYGVYLDGELIKDVIINTPEQTVELFAGNEKRTATVKVMHLSEASDGSIGVKEINVTSSSSKPVKPTPKKDLTIEFIGDSITCGYGVGTDDRNENFSTSTEDFSKTYAYLTAGLLDADYSTCCYSGFGIVSGYTSSGAKNVDSLLPPVYEQVAKISDYAVPWNFEANPSDVIVLNLGTNDDSYCSKDLETRGAEYGELYVKFLKQIRQCNPDATIICTLGIMGATELYPYIEAAVKEVGDEKISCYLAPTQNINEDGIGADWHPSPKTHQINAYLLADKICTAIGRSYSHVGVDFAADAEYSAVFDKNSKANGWPYYAEWNKSLNVNITAGGENPEDVTAHITGLNLPAGDYAFSCVIEGAKDQRIPYELRSAANPELVYFQNGLVGAADAVEIKIPDGIGENLELVFMLGDLGAANLTISNVKLIKTA